MISEKVPISIELFIVVKIRPCLSSAAVSVGHLDVEDFSEELLHQHSYAINNQLVQHRKPPTRDLDLKLWIQESATFPILEP